MAEGGLWAVDVSYQQALNSRSGDASARQQVASQYNAAFQFGKGNSLSQAASQDGTNGGDTPSVSSNALVFVAIGIAALALVVSAISD